MLTLTFDSKIRIEYIIQIITNHEDKPSEENFKN